MTIDNQEKFQQKFQAGKAALERGNYRLSIEHLEVAKDLVAPNSRRGGEAGIWLVTAYQSANKMTEAIALCQELIVHPNMQTRDQAQRILYIIKAPQLERPKEWMSEIPDLADADKGISRYVTAKKTQSKNADNLLEEDLEIAPGGNLSNQFIWFALFLIAAIVSNLIWFSRV